jgi:hypothetical protein
MVSGYVGARLQWQGTPIASGYQDYSAQCILENMGSTTFSVQIRQCSDYSVTGPRENLGAAVSLVPSGRKTVNFIPGKQYLEFQATAVTNVGQAMLKAQIVSKIRWDLMGFGAREYTGFAGGDPFYATLLLDSDNLSTMPSG